MKKPIARAGLILEEPSLYDRSSPGRCGADIPAYDDSPVPNHLARKNAPELPEVSELDVVRHYTRLSTWNYNIDAGFYPLGSCTMKYNPRVHETIASMSQFKDIHPLQPTSTCQGTLELFSSLSQWLSELTHLEGVSLQPAAGAQGEWTGLKVIAAYLKDHGLGHKKTILIPDSAHGTNPASAAMCGFQCKTLKTSSKGYLDFDEVLPHLTDDVAGMMITNPNTMGLFEKDIGKIAKALHDINAFLYVDGANMNALLGVIRPGDFGADVIHINLHKTFSTPHGGGGPGAGPIAVTKKLIPYLPTPFVEKKGSNFEITTTSEKSIGAVKNFYGQFGMIIRACAYTLAYGKEFIGRVAEDAVVNANYLRHRLRSAFQDDTKDPCMHEFVLSDKAFKATGVTSLDMAKALIDCGYHPPTMYFPLVVSGALMIEPTETESKRDLDRFADTMLELLAKTKEEPQWFQNRPRETFIAKVDEANAARNLCLCDPPVPAES